MTVFKVFLSVFLVTSALEVKDIVYDDIPTSFNNYKSIIEPLDESLQPIYEFSNDFIDLTVPVSFDVGLFGEDSEWQHFLDDYSGVLVYVVIMLIIGFTVPIVGIIFAISRCCCNCCGAKVTERHPKQGKASIIIAGGFSIVFTAFLFFAIVVGMRSNVVIESGAQNVFDKMIVTMRDTIKYSDNTYLQIEHLMQTNFEQFSNGLTNDLDEINGELSGQINPDDLKQVKDGFRILKDSRASLEKIKIDVTTISNGRSDMEDLKGATDSLATSCKTHTNPEAAVKCRDIKSAVTNWIIPPFEFPDLQPIITGMNKIDFNALDLIMDAMMDFKSILNNLLVQLADEAKINTAKAGAEIKKHLVASKERTDQVKQWMTSRIQDVDSARGYYDDWGQLRYGLTFLLPILLIVMVALVVLGFLTGICCRPSYYKEKGCSNASIAGDFFMTNVALICIFALVFAVAICGYYAIGLIGQRYFCNTFYTMDNTKGLKYLNDNLDIQQYFGDGVTLEHLLKTCNANKPLYEVLILKNEFDLDDIVNYLDDFGIKEALTKLTDTINERIKEFEKIYPIEWTNALKNIPLDDVDVLMYNDQISTMERLLDLLEELKRIDPTIRDINDAIAKYNTHIANFNNLELDFTKFQTEIKMGGTGTYQQRLIEFDTYLDEYHSSITSGSFAKWGNDLTETSIETVRTYLIRIKEKMLDTIGLCEPASNAIKATLNEVCGNVLNPINAFWLANFFALIAFIPLLGLFIYMVSYFRQYIMTDEDRYRQENYYMYNPPGARGSTIDAYDVRAHHQQPTSTIAHSQPSNARANPITPAQPISTTPLPPNHYYNPNNGNIAATPPTPLYPNAQNTSMGVQGRNLRRQQEYPYAMKGTSLPETNV